MIYYVEFDPVFDVILDYSTFSDGNLSLIKIDTNIDYINETTFVLSKNIKNKNVLHQKFLKLIKSKLIDKIRDDKLNYLFKDFSG